MVSTRPACMMCYPSVAMLPAALFDLASARVRQTGLLRS